MANAEPAEGSGEYQCSSQSLATSYQEKASRLRPSANNRISTTNRNFPLAGCMSGRRDSNPRRPAWEADILPLNYSRDLNLKLLDPKTNQKKLVLARFRHKSSILRPEMQGEPQYINASHILHLNPTYAVRP